MYDCIPYLKVIAIESLSPDAVTFCKNTIAYSMHYKSFRKKWA